ncbi:hypothetical protein WN55_01951 [Dufourea novaeangliae]|uniref:Uncharacterized protein n=1 Tax=Dufourea novaeangliae TaxID=178035 RepID=A0A154PGD0_DUFNO|nr:hypothetical protein WN55_01951 [Dufourea novaeangliae]
MYITTNNHFVPKQFIVCMFYDEKTCFCWNEDKLIIFPYTNNDFVSVEVLTAPAPIKNVQCFTNRIFLVCIPHGIYKLSRDRKFAILSTSAIGMGTVFYEILTVRNKYLYLDNKQTKTNKLLFQFSYEESNSNELCVYPLNRENTNQQFIGTITNKDSTVENLCLLTTGKKVLTLMNGTVQIIYNSVYSIRDIIPVLKDSMVAALLFLTGADIVIVMYAKDDTMAFEKVCLGTNIQALCAGFSRSMQDALWFVYSDGSKLYYVHKQLLVDNAQKLSIQDNNFACLQCYNSKIILGLTMDKQLLEISVDTVEKTLSVEHDTLINLRLDMLVGTNLIMDRIYKGTQEIHRLNEILLMEEDKLKRINLYAHKHKVQVCPKMSIHRIADKLFLSARFEDIFPKHSWVVLNVKLEKENISCTKKAGDQETVVDICIPEGKKVNSLQVTTDLITLKDEGHPWCLTRNYVTYPLNEKTKKKKTRSDKTNFINSKIAILENFIREGNIDMKKLSEIKRIVRREFSDA